uniref:Phosphoprotein n=1 Tax=Phala bat lyssavirus TaxID=3046997 RepID=A0A9Y1ZGK8_9RHAB|nr:phosphoprotein [Phala bat lyssavirus]
MSKIFVNPSAIRSGLADLELADETVNLINLNMEESQAHLQGVPIDVDSLPEEVQRLHITDPPPGPQVQTESKASREEDEEFYMDEGGNRYAPFQSYLDVVGSQMVQKMKTGEGFFKIWSETVEGIVSYVATNFPALPDKSYADKSVQANLEKAKNVMGAPITKSKRGPFLSVNVASQEASGPSALDWVTSNEEDDATVDAEIAHQVAESFSKKYKFPSRASGIFLWNFEQLKMNLDDIVREVKKVPGVTKLARDGVKLPIRCMLGSVASTHSKRFQILVNPAKLGKIMQDDINKYLAF